MSTEKNGAPEVHDDIDQRYVAALLIISESENMEVDEAHLMVTNFLKEFEIDVERASAFTSKKDRDKLH